MKYPIVLGILGLALVGAGCTADTNAVTYETFTAGDTGMAFDVPAGVTVHDNVNGFEDIWKFEYNGDSYIVSYNVYNDRAIYSFWETLSNDEVTVTTEGDVEIYKEVGMANTEAFFSERDPGASVAVSKHEGTTLNGETSTDDDAVYQHLVASVKLEGEAAF